MLKYYSKRKTMLKGNYENNILNCPFCSKPLDEPHEIKTALGNTFTGGKCECRAVFVYDRSGHNLGEAYMDALTFACDGDWDKALSLVPDEDYEVIELSYDSRRNKFSTAQRKIKSTFLFILVKTKLPKIMLKQK